MSKPSPKFKTRHFGGMPLKSSNGVERPNVPLNQLPYLMIAAPVRKVMTGTKIVRE